MLFNIFGKRKSDWKLDIDGVEKGECTVEDVKIDNVDVYREFFTKYGQLFLSSERVL